MPADIVTMRDCASNYGVFTVKSDSDPNKSYVVAFHGENGAHCTCKAWEFSPIPKNCKHIERVYNEGCMYNGQYNYDGNKEPAFVPHEYTYDAGLSSDEGDCCPACGGPTVLVKRAV